MTRERADLVRRWCPAFLWAIVISAFSTSWFTSERTSTYVLPFLAFLFPHARSEDLVAMHFAIRKLAHFTEYLILSTLLYRGLRGSQRWSIRAAGLALTIAGIYSIGDEFGRRGGAGSTRRVGADAAYLAYGNRAAPDSPNDHALHAPERGQVLRQRADLVLQRLHRSLGPGHVDGGDVVHRRLQAQIETYRAGQPAHARRYQALVELVGETQDRLELWQNALQAISAAIIPLEREPHGVA